MQLQGVIFDYGGVLCGHPTEAELDAFANLGGFPTAPFLESYWRSRWDFDRGDLNSETYWNGVARNLGGEFSAASRQLLDSADVQLWMTIDQAMLDWNAALRKTGIRTAILSNMPYTVADHLKNIRFFDAFDFVTLSCEVHFAKPETEIYRHCLAGLCSAPEATLFLDDRLINIEAAQQLGIYGYEFVTRDQFKSSGVLERYALPTLPA